MDSLCRVRNKIMYVLLWRTVYALARTLSWAHKQFATRVHTLFYISVILIFINKVMMMIWQMFAADFNIIVRLFIFPGNYRLYGILTLQVSYLKSKKTWGVMLGATYRDVWFHSLYFHAYRTSLCHSRASKQCIVQSNQRCHWWKLENVHLC